jgi:Flp pilus assembly protein CpaB
MGKLTVALIVVVALAVAAGGLLLAFWDIPAPSKPVEKVLPDARFPK